MTRIHPYHLVEVSPWPILMAFTILSAAFNLVSWFSHGPIDLYTLLPLGIIPTLWWRDVIRESKGGFHTIVVQKGITIGFLLFLLSEIMLFFSVFWAYFHSALAPNIELGATWPPIGIESINPWSLPLLGTCLLLASGFTVTLAHHALVEGQKVYTIINLTITILLGLIFVILQSLEYFYCTYTIADSTFGNCFFISTGLHGLHVIAGVIFLTVSLYRIYKDHYTTEHHLGFLFAAWYWHLVDVVWIFLYVVVYIWGGQ